MFAIEYTAAACASTTLDAVDEPSEIEMDNGGMSGGSSTTSIASVTNETDSAKEESKESTVASLSNSSHVYTRADSKIQLAVPQVRKPSSSVKSGTGKIPAVKESHSIPASVKVMKPQSKGKIATADSKLLAEHRVVRASKPVPPLYNYVDSIRLVTLLSCDGTVLK